MRPLMILTVHLTITVLIFLFLTHSGEGSSGPMLIFKMGKGGMGGGSGLATLLAVGAVAKLLQGGGGGHHSMETMFHPMPMMGGYGGGMMGGMMGGGWD